MPKGAAKIFTIALPLLALGALYLVAIQKHAQRDEIRAAAVKLTPACADKLSAYGLAAGAQYESPYVLQRTGMRTALRGYSEEDVRAIQRGCNIVSDTQGRLADDPYGERWNAKRFLRGSHAACSNCHRGVGDRHDEAGNRPKGSLHLGASWVMGDMYDRFTGLLLPYEFRQFQCYMNASNGYKPNVADDVIRDVTAYTRFLSAAVDMKIGNHYEEQGIDEIAASATLKQGDDYVRGEALYRQKCQHCHGPQGLGQELAGRLIAPALAGPNAWNLQSRNNFYFVSTILAGFICRNMPPGKENTLDNQECRDIAFYVSNLPRPAGDKQGPIMAVQQQIMMAVMPPLLRLTASGKAVVPQPLEQPAQTPAMLPFGSAE